MSQLALNLMCRHEGPAIVPPFAIENLGSYRDAVRLCWDLRRDVAEGAKSACARHIGAHVSHMSDYLSDEQCKRDMPAKFIKGFEVWSGNTAISQYIAHLALLTVLEEIQTMRRAA